ncbi:MAG: DNA primase, partial [Kiritimatiellaeota bacterium]|nr:DNA primase [Kiritimatiellota bacterium]
MMRFSPHTFDEIRSRLDIVGFIASYGVAVKRSGAAYKACCPFHKEKTPSFTINPQRQFYHCFGCGEHGDVITFFMKQTGLPFNEAVAQLAEKTGVKLESGYDPNAARRDQLLALHAGLAAFYQRCLLQSKEGETARAFLEGRQIGLDAIKRFGVGYAPVAANAALRWADKHRQSLETLFEAGVLAPGKSSAPYDRFAGRVTFPIHDAQGRVIAFSCRVMDPASHPAKYVNSPETPVFKKSQVLYGLHLARAAITKHPRREAILCEGQIDVIRCHSAGFETAVASQGTAFTPGHVEILRRYADSLLLAYDSDTAGRKAALKAGAMLLAAGLPVRVCNLPPGEDPDSLIRRDGPSAFQNTIARAVSLTAFQIQFLRDSEADPGAVDAVARVTRPVIETLASCPSAVLRAHLLSEAADLLRVPAAALQEDLEKFQALAAQRAALENTRQPSTPLETISTAIENPQQPSTTPDSHQPSAISHQP